MLLKFFSYAPVPETSPYYLAQFSLPHILAIAVLAALVGLIIAGRKKLASWAGEARLQLFATLVAMVFEISLHIIYWIESGWEAFLANTIPFDLCAICFWLSVALNTTGRRWLFDLLYFWGWGAFASFLFANTEGASWNTWHFYQYFVSHGYTLLTMTWFAAVRGYRPDLKSLARAAGALLPLSVGIRFFDLAFKDPPWKFNFSYLVRPPDVGTPLDAFGSGWGYYLLFAGLVAAVLVLVALPWSLSPRFWSPRRAD
jgi:hypothetical integral membrane protein (TIGR02206 family)